MKLMYWRTKWRWKGGDKTESKKNLLSPLSVWSLVSAGATQCQESWTTGTGGGMVGWHCPQQPSSSPSGHPLTVGWIELRERKREMSDGDTSLIQTWDILQTQQIGSKTMLIEDTETEDAVRDMTQNPNHYLTDAEICHTRTLRRGGMGIVFTGNRVWYKRSERERHYGDLSVNPFWQGQSKNTFLFTATALGSCSLGREGTEPLTT